MTAAAAQRRQRRQRLLVVHVHVVGGEAMWTALTMMCVSTPVCKGNPNPTNDNTRYRCEYGTPNSMFAKTAIY